MTSQITASVTPVPAHKHFIQYLLIILVGWFLSGNAFADVFVTNTTQTPQNDVFTGQSVSYSLTVNSQDTSFVNIEILVNGISVSGAFSSDAGGCNLDGIYFCGEQPAGTDEIYTFSWTPLAGTHNLTFNVNCSSGDISCTGDSSSVQTIVRDIQPGVLQLSSTSYQVNEGDAAVITVLRTGGSDGEQVVDVLIGGSGDTATSPLDYSQPASTTLTFPDGVTEQTLSIQTLSDLLDETDETFTVSLSANNQNITEPSSATVTIIDTTEPGAVQFSADNYQVTEGNTQTITVQRIGGSDGSVVVDVIFGVTADTATETDYTPPASTQLVFGDGVTTQTFDIAALDDGVNEGDETLSMGLVLDPDSAGSVGTPSEAILTISDPIQAIGELNFSSATYTASEQDGNAIITVTRTGGSGGALEVNVQLGATGDTATTDDYTAPASTLLSWADGDTTDKTLNIPLTADQILESDETLTLNLIAVNNAPIGELNQAVLTITDVPPVVETVNLVSGDQQTGTTGTVLDPFVVLVEDASGNPVGNTTVTWEITPSDGGTLESGSTTLTDENGNSSNILTLNTDELVVVTARVTDETVDPIIFRINGSLINTSGLTENQRILVETLTTVCDALSGLDELTAEQLDLLATCNRIESASDPTEELDLLLHDEVSSQGTAVIKAANLQVMNVNSRLNALRSGASGLSLSGLGVQVEGVALPQVVLNQLAKGNGTGGAAGNGGTFNRWGGFINGNISFGTKDRTNNENGFDFDTRGVTAGIDYRVSNDLVLGAALGYGTNESDFDSNSGDMEMDGWHITGYGTWYKNQQIYLDGVIKLGFNNYDTTRRVSLLGTTLQNALGDTDGKEFSMSFGGGYEFVKDAMTLGTYGRLGYTQADIDGYTETPQFSGVSGIGSMLSIADQDVDSLTTTLGAQVSYSISTKKGVFIPQGRLEWEHEFSNDQRNINAQFVADPTSTTFGIRTDEADRDYFNIGLGFSTVTTGGKSGFLYYETRIDQDDIEQHWIKGGFRFEF